MNISLQSEIDYSGPKLNAYSVSIKYDSPIYLGLLRSVLIEYTTSYNFYVNITDIYITSKLLISQYIQKLIESIVIILDYEECENHTFSLNVLNDTDLPIDVYAKNIINENNENIVDSNLCYNFYLFTLCPLEKINIKNICLKKNNCIDGTYLHLPIYLTRVDKNELLFITRPILSQDPSTIILNKIAEAINIIRKKLKCITGLKNDIEIIKIEKMFKRIIILGIDDTDIMISNDDEKSVTLSSIKSGELDKIYENIIKKFDDLYKKLTV